MRLCVGCHKVGTWQLMERCRSHHQELSLTMADINHYFAAIVGEAIEASERKLYEIVL
jgi:hypothetical protein